MALSGYVPDIRHPRSGGQDGLGLVPELRVLPHFDVYGKWIPDIVMRPLLSESTTVIGIDEQTAFRAEPPEDLEQPWSFRGVGRGSCWRIESDRKYRVNSPHGAIGRVGDEPSRRFSTHPPHISARSRIPDSPRPPTTLLALHPLPGQAARTDPAPPPGCT